MGRLVQNPATSPPFLRLVVRASAEPRALLSSWEMYANRKCLIKLCWLVLCSLASCLTRSRTSGGNRKYTILFLLPGIFAASKFTAPAWIASRIRKLLGTWKPSSASASRDASSSVSRSRLLLPLKPNSPSAAIVYASALQIPTWNFQSPKGGEAATSSQTLPFQNYSLHPDRPIRSLIIVLPCELSTSLFARYRKLRLPPGVPPSVRASAEPRALLSSCEMYANRKCLIRFC